VVVQQRQKCLENQETFKEISACRTRYVAHTVSWVQREGDTPHTGASGMLAAHPSSSHGAGSGQGVEMPA